MLFILDEEEDGLPVLLGPAVGTLCAGAAAGSLVAPVLPAASINPDTGLREDVDGVFVP